MAFRLRRGTNTERQTQILVQGELIYVTDYVAAGVSPLWVGDGTTPGGQEIATGSGSPSQLTQNLDLNGFNIAGNGSITATSFVGDGSGLTNLPTITSANIEELNNVVITSPSNGEVLTYDNGSWINSPATGGVGDGVVEGSNYRINIIGSDSTLLVDSDAGQIDAPSLVGVVPNGSISESAVTQHQSALSITESQISDLQAYALASALGSFTFTGTTLDTDDSSGIVVTPVTTFSSDLTVENNLIVNNKLVVDTIEVQNLITASSGTPEIVSDTQLLLTAGTDIINTATAGNIELNATAGNVSASANAVDITSATNIANTATTGNITLTASAGNVALSGTNINATGAVNITGATDVTGNLSVSNSIIIGDQTIGGVATPVDGEMIFDATEGQLYIRSDSFTSWLKILSVDFSGGLLETGAVLIPGSFDEATKATVGEDSSSFDGAMLYNTDADRVEFFQAGSWVRLPNNGTSIGEVLKWNGNEWVASIDTGGVAPGSNADFLDGFDGTYYLDYNNFANTPTIPSDTGDLTNSAGFVTATSTATFSNKSGAISQWTNDSGYLTTVAFADLTGKPTTISGYGITDAYVTGTTLNLGSQALTGATSITGASGGDITQFTNITGDTGGTISQFLNITGDTGGTISGFTNITGDTGGTISQFLNITGDTGGTISGFTNITGDTGGTISQFTNITGDGAGSITGFDIGWSLISSTPTTLTGYGITDAATSAQGTLADTAVQPADLGNFTFTGSVLDTSDSSGITVTPAVTVSSDLTVDNNLTVANKIVANTIEVENIITTPSAGTPELYSDGSILLTAGTRVEVTQSPFKMASFTTTERNALSAVNGDMIYNTTTNKFQGYANGTWVDLH